ncbi:MAG: hypothetical protein QOD94_225 [Alphaproteobacteria bacterium]|nr:hypothetical protein [Alphaproteobacteria bacterium]
MTQCVSLSLRQSLDDPVLWAEEMDRAKACAAGFIGST